MKPIPKKELKVVSGKVKVESPSFSTLNSQLSTKWLWLLPLGIAILTFICYHYSLGNQFTNWDDERFIPENIFIKSFSAENLKMMMFHDVTGDYFNPVTILSYAINFHFSGLNPESYYLTNIIIHIFNSCLMFFMVIMLLKAMERAGYGIFKSKEWLALFCTLAYAVHPMHVESVSWAAERKDVLYAFFYFLGIMAYLQFTGIKSKKYLWFFLLLLCFLLSLLSKPMAVVFPFSLLAIDVLLKRDKTTTIINIFLEKLPFIVISILSAIWTYHLQRLSGAVQEHQPYSLFQRFFFAFYSFNAYILKAFVPIFQSSYYPYPQLENPTDPLPIIYYLSPLIAIAVAAIPLYISYRSGKNNLRVVLFGLGFYFFNMIIISQIVGSGPTLMADRYSYVCYFGIFFPLMYFIYRFIQPQTPKGALGQRGYIVTTVISAYLLLFAFLTYQRTLVWHNSQTLWSDVIEKYPHRIIKAYNNLGNFYFKQYQTSNSDADLDKAYNDYKEAIDLKVGDPQVYCNMGSLMGAKKDYKSSLYYYKVALSIDSNDSKTYLDRAITYSAMGNIDLAIKDYRHSARLDPNSEILYRNIAYTYFSAHQFDSAINYYSRAIKINPYNAGYYHFRGVAKYDNGEVKESMADFTENLSLEPKDGECMFYISIVYNRLGDLNNAYKYAQMAINAQYNVPDDYLRLLKARLDVK